MNRLKCVAAALILAACTQPDSIGTGPRSIQMSSFSSHVSSSSQAKSAPDPAAARAEEAAALADIEAHLSPETRSAIVAILKGEKQDGFRYLVRGKTSEWNARYARFYAAQAHRVDEERRDASVTAAYQRGGIPVVVALGNLPSGTVASVLRRTAKLPPTVILLGPSATGTTLGGAFAALDQSRKLEGDDLTADITLGITDVHATSIQTGFQARLDQLIARLKSAPVESIDGIGSVRVIALRSLRLQAPGHP